MFKFNNINIGPLYPKDRDMVVFPYEGLTIIEMNASCGCSVPKDDTANKQVTVNFLAPEIPEHLLRQGKDRFTTAKTIKVFYTIDGDVEKVKREVTLVFTALILKHPPKSKE